MEWLLRYALHAGVPLADLKDPRAALRRRFSAAAWRLMWRSGRDAFLPILRNARLGFDDLRAYVDQVVVMGFPVAPAPHLVQHLIDETYRYRDSQPDVRFARTELILIRLAQRSGRVSRREFNRVLEWVVRTRPRIHDRRAWRSLVREATAWQRQMAIELAHADDPPWVFETDAVDVGEFGFVALKTPRDLWCVGQGLGQCLYALRHLCERNPPSRFFLIRSAGVAIGAAELQPGPGTGRWFLRDVRRSFNRLPGPAMLAAAEALARAYGCTTRIPPARNCSKSAGRSPTGADRVAHFSSAVGLPLRCTEIESSSVTGRPPRKCITT